MVGLLRRMGLQTLGDFAGLPAADVHTRFGTHGELLHRLARGLDPQPVGRRQVPPEFDATLLLEPPLELIEPIAFSLRTTAEGFVNDLAAHGLVCTTVLIEVDADGSLATARRWMHPRWFGATDLIDRVRWQLQADGAVRAPVDAVRLIPEVTEPLGDHADSLFGGGPDERVERGVARVQSIVGHESVVSASVQGGRGPADRRLLVPWGERVVRQASRGAAVAGQSAAAGTGHRLHRAAGGPGRRRRGAADRGHGSRGDHGGAGPVQGSRRQRLAARGVVGGSVAGRRAVVGRGLIATAGPLPGRRRRRQRLADARRERLLVD